MAKIRLGKLKREIERKREELISSGMVKGLKHPDTIKISEELDRLINQSMTKGGKR